MKARFSHCENSGVHISSCFFADSSSLGLARVQIDESRIVTSEIIGPEFLPGVPESNGEHVLLRILTKMLHSEANSIEFLSTPSPASTNTKLIGTSYFTGDETTLELGDLIGVGGFADVYLERAEYPRVIKVLSLKEPTLSAMELHVLVALADSNTDTFYGFPHLDDALMKDGAVLALVFRDIGITVGEYINLIGDNTTKLIELKHSLSTKLPQILTFSHQKCIYHNDLRKANILLVPVREDVKSKLFSKNWQSIEVVDQICSLNLDEFDIVINDWGNAERLQSRIQSRIEEELSNLHKMIESLGTELSIAADFGQSGKEMPVVPTLKS